jgi:8-oxo-dGTP diphosphatase
LVDSTLLTKLASQATAAGIQQFVVGAVVQSQNEVLLLRRPEDDFMGGLWELPSGKVEPGEALDAALLREVKEETGLDVSAIQRYLGSFDYTSGSGKPSRQFNFAVDVAAAKPVVLQERDVYQWAKLDGELPVTDAVKTVLKAYAETGQAD